MIVLDALRRQRNVADYSGGDIDDSLVKSCIDEARRFINDVLAWRESHRADLVPKRK